MTSGGGYVLSLLYLFLPRKGRRRDGLVYMAVWALSRRMEGQSMRAPVRVLSESYNATGLVEVVNTWRGKRRGGGVFICI